MDPSPPLIPPTPPLLPPPPPPATIKVCLIGDSSTGKTALRARFLFEAFTSSYKATIGADFLSKTMTVDGIRVRLSLWDTAGQDRFRSLASAFYRGSDAVIMVYDVSSPSSLASLPHWLDEFRSRCPVEPEDMRDFAWVAVGNKADLGEAEGQEETDKLLRELLASSGDGGGEGAGRGVEVWREGGYIIEGSSPSPPPPPPPTRPPQAYSTPPLPQTTACTSTRALSAPSSPHINVLPPLPPSIRKSTVSAGSSIETGTMHSTRTTQTIYHTPSTSLHDSSTSLSLSSDGSTIRNAPEPLSPFAFSDEDDLEDDLDNGESYFTVAEEVSQRAREKERAHGVDVFMSSSPPPTPPEGLPRGRASFYTNPHEDLLQGTSWGGRGEEAGKKEDGGPEEDERDYAADGLKRFRTSAKTGEGVQEVFEYLVRRVLWKWRKNEKEEGERRRRSQVVNIAVEGTGSKLREACCT